MALVWTDLKDSFPPERWTHNLSGLDEVVLGERFLSMARAWLAARLKPCGLETWDEDGDQIVRQALLYRAQYEFYAYFEQEDLAQDKRQVAEELLRGRFGRCVDGAEESGESASFPYVYVSPGSDNWRGFKA